MCQSSKPLCDMSKVHVLQQILSMIPDMSFASPLIDQSTAKHCHASFMSFKY